MDKPLYLSQAGITAFLACNRRFQLRYLENFPWPESPLTPDQQTVINRGQEFHQILERYFLGLSILDWGIQDAQIKRWWDNFQRLKPKFPKGHQLPEHRLTVPIGRHFLIGRFDLLIIGEKNEQPFAWLYDWKTSQPRPFNELADDWQTRLYLILLAESGQALTGKDHLLKPENIAITYWYAGDPAAQQTIYYSESAHAKNLAAIREILQAVETAEQKNEWPLTDNWSHCRSCLFQVYCGRQSAGRDILILAEDAPVYNYSLDFLLEPDSP